MNLKQPNRNFKNRNSERKKNLKKKSSKIQSKVSQKEKDRCCILMHAYGIQKDGTDKPICRVAMGFPHSSVGKESVCNAGDPSSIPGSRRSTGERIGYLLQYAWASLVAQLVKNPPAMREIWIQSLGWEDSPGEGKGYPLQYSGLENSMDCIVHGVTKSQTRLSNFHFHHFI